MTTPQQETSNVSIYDFLILALAYKPHLYKDIDKLYEANRIPCMLAYHASSYKDSPALKHHTTMNQVYIRKVAGLFAWTMKEHQLGDLIPCKETQPIYALIKKGYKFAWNYVQNKKVLVLDLFSHDYIQKVGEDKVKELDLIHQETCLLFLAHMYEKRLNTKGIMYGLLQKHIQETCKLGDAIVHTYSKEQIDAKREDITRLRHRFNIGTTKQTLNLENVFELLIRKETEQIPDFHAFKMVECRERVFKEGDISRYIGALSGCLKSLSLNETELVTLCDIPAKEMDELLYMWLYFQKGNNLPQEMESLFLVALFFLKALSKEYKQTKHQYLEIASEEQFHDLLRLQQEIDVQKEAVQKEALSVHRLEATLNEERKRYEMEMEALRAELKQANQRIEALEKNEKELVALRTYIHHEADKEDDFFDDSQETFDSCLAYLKKKRIVILGGHVKWQQKLKELLPHITLLNPEQKNTDLSFLNHTGTHLFVNTATNSHSFMKRVFSQLQTSESSLHYIHANQNMERTAWYMKEMIENE